jgi:Reverse transcriptase (RNA-dependent DNA polymerase)/Endonuclease-reverse transcriptase
MTLPTQHSLTILLWNSNGLNPHRDELDLLLHDKRIDIALITETHFTDKSYFKIRDYTTYRTDHPDNRSHGGAAILVRTFISHFLVPNDPTDFLQSTTIKVSSPGFDFSVSAVYCPPNKRITQHHFSTFLSSLGSRFLVGGDFNAKHPQWGCRVANPRGGVLLNTLSQTDHIVLSPSSPTYWPTSLTKRPDILDIFIASSSFSNLFHSIENLYDLTSDHSPVLLVLDTQPLPTLPKPSLANGPIDYDSFAKHLEKNLHLNIHLKTDVDIDEAVQTLTKKIQEAVWHSSSEWRPRPSSQTVLPLTIRELITKKRRACAKWQQHRYPSDKRTYNRLNRRLTKTIKEYNTDKYNQYTASLTNTDQSLWTATRRILQYKHSSSPILKEDNTWAKSNEEKAEAFALHLSNIFQPHPILDPSHVEQVNNTVNYPLQMSPPPSAFSPSDVEYAIKSLKDKKAPGYDLITPKILKHLPKKALLFLTYIYNAVLRSTHFPTVWKFSTIIMIPKPNKPTHLPSSYRPISLLPIMGKILEKLLLRRLLPILDSQNIIPNHQFGFRSHHSSVQQCHRVVDTISSSLESKHYCSTAFLDVEQAFDRVWHDGLLAKLKGFLPFTYYLILKSFLSDRSFQVSQSYSVSTIYPVGAGVPQGSILAPILYTIYTADLPTHPSTILSTFADDTCILSPHSDPAIASHFLQVHLNSVAAWCHKWRIKLNPKKSSHITFTLRRSPSPPVFLNNNLLPSADIVRYLGLYLDKRLTWNPHTRLKRQETNRRYRLLLRLLDGRSKLTMPNKLLIYKTIIQPTWAYGLELWGSTKRTNLNRIQSLQSKILRKIVDAPFYVTNLTIHNDLKVPFVHDLVRSRYKKFHESTIHHPNPLVLSLSSNTLPLNPTRRLRRCWPRDLLVQ